MVKRIKITLLEQNVSAIAELHEDLAPKTCKEIWDALPFESVARHAAWAGREIWAPMPPNERLKKIPPENRTLYPIPGDLLYDYFPPAWEGGARGAKVGICDFTIWYGRDSPIYQPTGPHPMNHFATITENFKAFAEACEKIWYKGSEKIRVERVE